MNQMFNPHENLRKWPKVLWAEGLQVWHQEVRSPWPGQSEKCSRCSKPPEPRVQIERDGFGPKAIETGGKCTGKLQNPMVYHVPTKWLDGHLWRYTGIGISHFLTYPSGYGSVKNSPSTDRESLSKADTWICCARACRFLLQTSRIPMESSYSVQWNLDSNSVTSSQSLETPELYIIAGLSNGSAAGLT